MTNYTKVIAVLILTTDVYIFHIHGMAQHCIDGSDIVPPCSNVTIPTNQMLIPVNSSIGQGCLCDVTVVHGPDPSRLYEIYVRHAQKNKNCGYQVDVLYKTTTSSITCLEFGSFSNTLRQGEFQRLRFIRDSTPNPPTAGFCLQVISQNKDVQFNIHCWDINGRRPPTTTAVEIDPSLSSSVTHRKSSPATTVLKQTTLSSFTPPTTTEEEIDSSLLSSVTHRKSSPATTVLKQTTLPSTLQVSAVTQRHTLATQTWTPTTAESDVQTTINGVTNKSSVIKIQVAAIGGGIGGGLFLLIVIIVIICLCKRRHNNNYGQPFDRVTESTNYNNLRVKDEMVIIDNDLYVSYNHGKNQSTTPPTPGLQPVEGHTYANTNGQVLPEANHSTPDLQYAQGHTYANIDEQQPSQTNHSTSNQHHAQPSVTTADNKSTHDDMIILDNDLHVSADSSPISAADIDDNTSIDELDQTQFAFKPNQDVNKVYAVVNKKKKPNTLPNIPTNSSKPQPKIN